MVERNCWEAVVSALEAEGVEYVFGMPGSSKMLYDALYDSKKIRSIHAQRPVERRIYGCGVRPRVWKTRGVLRRTGSGDD
jgi:glyoxylate carboligase